MNKKQKQLLKTYFRKREIGVFHPEDYNNKYSFAEFKHIMLNPKSTISYEHLLELFENIFHFRDVGMSTGEINVKFKIIKDYGIKTLTGLKETDLKGFLLKYPYLVDLLDSDTKIQQQNLINHYVTRFSENLYLIVNGEMSHNKIKKYVDGLIKEFGFDKAMELIHDIYTKENTQKVFYYTYDSTFTNLDTPFYSLKYLTELWDKIFRKYNVGDNTSAFRIENLVEHQLGFKALNFADTVEYLYNVREK